jgi:hypothetical protein
VFHPQYVELIERFLAEWPKPAPASPWKCCVCGQPVRIGDDLWPYHLAGPGNHDAELSGEDRKTLADRADSRTKRERPPTRIGGRSSLTRWRP